MRIAIPQWEQRVSPILDNAGSLVLVDTEVGGPERPSAVPLTGVAPLERAVFLQRLGVDFVICGAISRPLQLLLDAAGIAVIANTSGPIEQVLRTFLTGPRVAGGGPRRTRRGARTHRPPGRAEEHVTHRGRHSGRTERSHRP